jgi:hypothetical protein
MRKVMDDLDCCRTCGHFYGYHFNTGMTIRGHEFADGQCDPFTDRGCNCKDFIPGDNLAFLEWKAKRGF